MAGSSTCASAVAAAACRRTPRMAQHGLPPLRGAEASSLWDRAVGRVAAHAGRCAAGAAAALQREKHRLENGRAGRGQTKSARSGGKGGRKASESREAWRLLVRWLESREAKAKEGSGAIPALRSEGQLGHWGSAGWSKQVAHRLRTHSSWSALLVAADAVGSQRRRAASATPSLWATLSLPGLGFCL